jgi:hypothetical protein
MTGFSYDSVCNQGDMNARKQVADCSLFPGVILSILTTSVFGDLWRMQIANSGQRKAMLVRGLAEVVLISKTLHKINVVDIYSSRYFRPVGT